MGQFIDREWSPRFASGLARGQDRSGLYRAYLPDPLVGRSFSFEHDLAADVADAERAIARLDIEAQALGDTEALARLLLRAESVASSKIEGLVISPQRLLRADNARAQGDTTIDPTASEVLANVDAMSYALLRTDVDITVDVILEFHRRLLAPTQLESIAGRMRTEQNWIGGTRFNPFGAAFVPPPPEFLADLLDDLCTFCNESAMPAVAQAAIAHAQFETIHPFADGNGRTGRALVHMIFKRRSLITRTLPPVSLILATHADAYVAALQATRFEGPPDSDVAARSTRDWIGLFAGACTRAVADSEIFERRVAALQRSWRERLAHLRSDAAALRLIDQLPRTPIVSARSVETALDISFEAANNAIATLESVGILTPTRVGRRNRAFEARELVDAFTDLERRLASAQADTKMSEPSRNVPPTPKRRRG
jgi:Fic family protein